MSPIQSAEIIGVAKEATFGTFKAPTNFIPGICTINSTTKVARPEQSRGQTRDYVVDALVGIEVGATINAELIPEQLPVLLAGWYGTNSDTLTGAAKTGRIHTMVPKITVPSFSLEVDHDAVVQTVARRLVGCNVDQVILRGTQQALATMEFTLLGQKEETPASPNYGLPSNATPTFNSQQPIDHSRLTAMYKGVEVQELQDYTLTMMNHVQRVFSANKQIYIVRLVPTRREIQFQTTLDFLNANIYNDWLAGNWATGPAFTLKYETAYTIEEGGGPTGFNKIEFKLARLRPMGQFNLQAASDVLNEQITWSTVLGESENIVETVWTNGTNSAYN
jgi:hypothetical protein